MSARRVPARRPALAAGAVALLGALAAACDRGAPEPVSADDAAVPARAAAPLARAGDLVVLDAVAPAPPVASGPMALYVTVVNTGTAPDTLVGVETLAAETAEVHGTQQHDGMAHMAPAGPLAVAPGDTLRLAPGGRHVMLQPLRRAFTVGDTLAATLLFRRAGAIPLVVPVVGYDAVLDRTG